MHRAAVVVVVVLVVASCGSDESRPETSAPATTTPTPTSTTSVPATTTTTVAASTTSTTVPSPPTPFTDAMSFALEAGPDEWSKQFIDPGAVVFHGGVWHMFYNGIDRWPGHVNVGYATSPDGIAWTKQSPTPVFVTSDIPYAPVSAFMSDVEVLDDGTWAMWFYTVASGNSFATGEIGRLTAPDPFGPWVADLHPSITHGPDGSWDSGGTVAPSVLRVGDEWWMWFDGNMGDLEGEGDRSIGLATSSDGVAWTKYDDPATTDPPYEVSDPVLVTDPGSWDERRVYDPGVERTDDGFVMTYFTRAPGTSSPEYDVGLAFSADGIEWTRDSRNPFFRSGSFGISGVFLSTLIRTDAGYVLLFDAQSSPAGGTTIWYRLHEGGIELAP